MSKNQPLVPRLEPLIKRILTEQTKTLHGLVTMFGSPLNVIAPQLINSKVEDFQSVLKRMGILGRVYFAHKCNKSLSFLAELSACQGYVDVASCTELRDALSRGIPASRIEATGPKSVDFIALCICHQILLSADSVEELQIASSIAKQMGSHCTVSALLRLSEFQSPEIPVLPLRSKFGVKSSMVASALEAIRKLGNVDLQGFSFHLNTSAERDRVLAIEESLLCMEKAAQFGFNPRLMSIGGGFSVNLLEPQCDWDEYHSQLVSALVGETPSMTWNNHSYGAFTSGGKLLNRMNIFPIATGVYGSKQLESLLNTTSDRFNGISLGNIIADCGYELLLEPGKALVATLGFTLGQVLGVKEVPNQPPLVVMNMNETNTSVSLMELFLDPFLLSDGELLSLENDASSVAVYIGGNLCLERDLISRRTCRLARTPKRGDILVFANSGGYSMDFYEGHPLKHPTAQKVAAFQASNEIKFVLDNEYSPFYQHKDAASC
jgi:diaminopimelate decarboxylase